MKHLIFLLALVLATFSTIWAQNDSLPNPDTLLATETVMPLQFGFVHPIGSNGLNSTNVYNKVSINALVGRSKGVIGAEFSGIYSENMDHAIGFKGTGILDIVHGSMMGMQAAGIMATAGQNSRGMQAAGIMGVCDGNFKGMQAGGIMCTTTEKFVGMQAAGIMAVVAGDSMQGMQAAGILSVTKGNVEGMQAAGIMSRADNVDGLQTAGIVNKAGYVKGAQIGLINIADSVGDKSVQIGLLNIVRKGGVRRFGVINTEFMNATLFMKTGTRYFFGYVGIGSQIGNKDYYFAPMIGVGTSIRLNNRFSFDPEWMQWYVNRNGRFLNNQRGTQIQQLRAMFSFSAGKKGPYITAGPTINLAWSSYKNANGEVGMNFSPSYFYNKTFTSNQVNVRAWLGYSVSVSFGR
jgi:hypothetical protein